MYVGIIQDSGPSGKQIPLICPLWVGLWEPRRWPSEETRLGGGAADLVLVGPGPLEWPYCRGHANKYRIVWHIPTLTIVSLKMILVVVLRLSIAWLCAGCVRSSCKVDLSLLVTALNRANRTMFFVRV